MESTMLILAIKYCICVSWGKMSVCSSQLVQELSDRLYRVFEDQVLILSLSDSNELNGFVPSILEINRRMFYPFNKY